MHIFCLEGSGTTANEVAETGLFTRWLDRQARANIRIESVVIYAAHRFDNSMAIKMMHLKAEAYDSDGRKLPGITFLRGDTVEIVAVLTVPGSDARHIVLVRQPRVPGGQEVVVSLPAGMVDEEEHVDSAALRELGEETGIAEETSRVRPIQWSKPIDLVASFIGGDEERWTLVSPGGSDERAKHVYVTAEVTPKVLARLQDRFAGAAAEGERTHVLVVSGEVLLVSAEDAIRALANSGDIDIKALTGLLLIISLVGRRGWS